MIFWFQQINIS